ncbi:hypothetical protein OQH61_06810 [Helicobacter sp. MIT 21-1697]|uniref:hypothetical protein n=1 Tax=Helicobacter sp. MIT 21-1697 TaxID=2993733 RepID=UPI00224A7EAF|nr:hypothetical protein [Helicobacter sp. MIT 21-1697]MCX2717442.1 hypothetical protein [Helicobacter sp. MIT 21-1697]
MVDYIIDSNENNLSTRCNTHISTTLQDTNNLLPLDFCCESSKIRLTTTALPTKNSKILSHA